MQLLNISIKQCLKNPNDFEAVAYYSTSAKVIVYIRCMTRQEGFYEIDKLTEKRISGIYNDFDWCVYERLEQKIKNKKQGV
ncbi:MULTISPECIES: hypothetical protein [Staphylococcus]|uniref:hypothetical protein n=1 Tax=Staphylococcus TaxID=1279 RepID=UPI0005C7D98A|nr:MULTISPECIES: hypothetical protein [Staphylococcus]MDG4944218.1 hypothetical protein [Staphylococcus agnetis]HDH6083003.1 hypothetical protein [Staphylococcus aureus]